MKLAAFIEDHLTRGLRLAILLSTLALIYPRARIYALLCLVIFLLVYGFFTRRSGGWRYVLLLTLLGAAGLGCLIYANHDRAKVEQYLDLHRPLDLSLVPDGFYEGEGPGNNGLIRTRLTIADGKLMGLEVLRNRDAVYAFDDVVPHLIGKAKLDTRDLAGFIFRNERSLSGLQASMENAVLPAIFDAPQEGRLSKTVFWLTSNQGGKITFNSLAVLFIVLLAFDFFLGPTLRPGLGQALNCYNCQACVGVCPVKMVAGDPFPMIMVLEARLGNIEHVAQLAKYCVGCGKCAAKCPVGNSGPSIASSAYYHWRQRRRRAADKTSRRIEIEEVGHGGS